MKNGSKKGFLLVKIDFAFLPTAFIVYRVLVHYRIGSLEKARRKKFKGLRVHYRIGSLENPGGNSLARNGVHYRIGSLEKYRKLITTY